MKRSGIFIVILIIILSTALVAGAVTTIKGSKHDLSSTSGPGPIKSYIGAGGTSEICVFCHTPHSARTDAPLWNRSINLSATYTPYSSDVMSALSYTSGDSPTTIQPGDPHVKTRLCLSCHDGTIALGSVVNLPYGLTSEIRMQQNNALQPIGYTMPQNFPGYIGADLRDDHPVSIQYLKAKDPELVSAPSISGKIGLYGNNSGKLERAKVDGYYVECTSCHDAHDNQNGNFLVDSNSGSNICRSCHAKALGSAGTSAHDAATTVAYNPDNAGTIGSYVSDVKCMNCHFPHKAGINDTTQLPNAAAANLSGKPRLGYYLLTYQEEMSCFNNKSRWTNSAVNACHGVNANNPNRNIETVENNNASRRHWTGSTDSARIGVHYATEGSSGAKGWINETGSLSNWHVECADCHNPHTAKSTYHTAPTNIVDSASPLYGSSGVDMTVSPTWAVRTDGNYNYVKGVGVTDATGQVGVTKEHQICFKCHSDFAWAGGAGTIPDSTSLGGGNKMTNQAMEFGSNSSSYHPVVQTTGRTLGTLDVTNFGWNQPPGTNLMYCSDCHTNDGNLRPKGPHGSGNSAILAWLPNGSQYGSVGGQNQQNTDLCLRCHASSKYNTNAASDASGGTGFTMAGNVNLHNRHYYLENGGSLLTNRRVYKCVNCHARTAHGMNRKALVVYRGDGPAYEAEGANTGLINNGAASLPAPGSYVKTSCASYNANSVTGCHD